jgi:hypothetical protein
VASSTINDLYLHSSTPTLVQVHHLSTLGTSKATLSAVIHQLSSGVAIQVRIMGSNDLGNWFELAAQSGVNAVGPVNLSAASAGWAYVMVEYKITQGTGHVVLSSTLNTGL